MKKEVKNYLTKTPPEQRDHLNKVRQVILDNLPKGYEEVIQYGMIGYVVPLSLYPSGYLGKKIPLPYAYLAAQKNHLAIYLMSIYASPKTADWFRRAYKDSGKKMDIGKSCVRFKKAADLPLDIIGQVIAKIPPDKYIKIYEQSKRP